MVKFWRQLAKQPAFSQCRFSHTPELASGSWREPRFLLCPSLRRSVSTTTTLSGRHTSVVGMPNQHQIEIWIRACTKAEYKQQQSCPAVLSANRSAPSLVKLIMLGSNEDRPSKFEQRLELRFVAALPGSKEARRETKAAIRAHASRVSWARYGNKSQGAGKSHKRPISLVNNEQQGHIRFAASHAILC